MDSDKDVGGYLELLAVIGQDFATSLDVDRTLKRALNHIMTYLDAEAASVFLLENDDTELVCRVCVGPVDITGIRLDHNQGIVGQSIADSDVIMVRDARADPRFSDKVDAQTGFTTRSILSAPLTVKERKLGALELINKRSGDGLFDEADRQVLRALAASAAMAINNARMTLALVDQERLRRELDLTAELQRALLPERRPGSFPVHGINLPARQISGDFYDFFALPDGRICFNLGDVSGKGINASLMMAKTISLYRCLGKSIHSPGRLMGVINTEISETATRGMFVTMVGGIYDPKTDTVCLANAGHEPPILMRADGAVDEFPAEAPPLGISAAIFPDARYPEVTIGLDGGGLYIFTDGVTEGRVDGDNMLGLEGLTALLREHAKLSPPDRLDRIVGPFRHVDQPLHDDLTVLVVEQFRGGRKA